MEKNEQHDTPVSSESKNDTGVSSIKKKILVVEDDPLLSEMLSTKLRESDFDVYTAGSGEEALEVISNKHPHLVLLDLLLPSMSGYEVLERMRALPAAEGVIAVACSNLGQDDDVKRAMSLGAKDFIVKANHTPQDIVKKIQKLLG